MSVNINHVYVRPDGVICACIVPVPDEKQFGNNLHYSYERAIQSCKEAAVPFEDQKEAELEVFKEWFAQSDEDDSWSGLKSDTLYPLSCEVEIMLQVRHGIEWHDLPGQNEGRDPEGIYQKVSRLITGSKDEPVQEESQEDLKEKIEFIKGVFQCYVGFSESESKFTIIRKP